MEPVVDSSEPEAQPKELSHPMEPVAPMDILWKRASPVVVPENTIVVSTITPYQLVRLLTAWITLVDSIKTTAMVNLGAMGNFIHPRFVSEHKLVTKDHSSCRK